MKVLVLFVCDNNVLTTQVTGEEKPTFFTLFLPFPSQFIYTSRLF